MVAMFLGSRKSHSSKYYILKSDPLSIEGLNSDQDWQDTACSIGR